ncbi:MAG: septation regulator SpoVG [Clostridia bacterium]|nr:septation regulator SpoVG [Clostridia bacterium]
MKISDIRIRRIQKQDGMLKAVASITIDDCFVIHDIKILEGENGIFIGMPSRKTAEGDYKDIAHPLNSETRDMIRDVILTAYRETE